MIEVPVYNSDGEQIETLQIDEQALGGFVRPRLLKQAIVMYHANRRQGTAATKSRGMVEGSTRKLYRQKGTGRARMGSIRSPVRRGGGVAFAKRPRDFSQDMPTKMRRLARANAVLAKLLDGEVLVIDELKFEQPKTRQFAAILKNLKIDSLSCLVTIARHDEVVWKSVRNIEGVTITTVPQLNAWDILRHRRLLFTKEAFLAFAANPMNPAAALQAEVASA